MTSPQETGATPKILYILGGGHSGSTLLDLILGSCDEVFSGGELFYYDYYKDYRTLPWTLKRGRICTCGKGFDDCPIWEKVNFPDENNIICDRPIGQSVRIAANLLNPWSSRAGFPVVTGKNSDLYRKIQKVANDQHDGIEFIVDSSKDPRRLYELVIDPKIPNEDISVIHLVRDVRGYVNSYQKTTRSRPPRSAVVSAFEWLVINVFSELVVRRFRLRSIQVSYDEFTSDFSHSLERLSDFLNIEIAEQDLARRIEETVYHNVHGNPMRLGSFKGIKRDTKWREKLGPVKVRLLGAFFWPFLRRWVYRRSEAATD